MGVFKAYDIRGFYPEEVTPLLAYKLGKAIVKWTKSKEIIVGRDCRTGSPTLHKELVKGITEQGANVLDIGLSSTPMMYFAAAKAPAIMVTASHNPAEYNGFKICNKGARAIGTDSGLKEIQQLTEQEIPKPEKQGSIKKWNIVAEYATHVKKFAKDVKELKVVVDGSNGMVSIALPEILKGIPIKMIPLFFEMDGRFPNHEPNPLKPTATNALAREVRKVKADMGVAYDADCDRIFFLDEKGERITSGMTYILLANYLLKENKDAPIIATVNLTQSIEEEVNAKILRTPVGHSFIKNYMRDNKAIFGGEQSGHFYYKENNYADSGDVTLMIMLSILSSTNKKLSELVLPLRKYAKSEELNLLTESPKAAMTILEKHYTPKAKKVEKIDGRTFRFDTWWFNMRASHTSPFLRINVEASNKEELDKRTAEVFAVLGRNPPN